MSLFGNPFFQPSAQSHPNFAADSAAAARIARVWELLCCPIRPTGFVGPLGHLDRLGHVDDVVSGGKPPAAPTVATEATQFIAISDATSSEAWK
ncbi:MAG: hypothetical protein JNL18_14915 [Planctomycetaceae bacterium]|nr:hypothetical protein [Planctomycetaceae bacterium]